MDYNIGDVIEYVPLGGTVRQALVTYRDPDIKNERPGFDGKCLSGDVEGANIWGYDAQITRVISRA
jgi:hypothetical protein